MQGCLCEIFLHDVAKDFRHCVKIADIKEVAAKFLLDSGLRITDTGSDNHNTVMLQLLDDITDRFAVTSSRTAIGADNQNLLLDRILHKLLTHVLHSRDRRSAAATSHASRAILVLTVHMPSFGA